MKRLIFSLQILAVVAFGPAALVTSASAEIISECQEFAEDFSEYYVTKRANVREVPNMDGRIHATLPAGSTIYTNEYLRDTSFNPEKWYLLLPSKSLPPISGCIAGFIHPSLVSKTPPSTQANQDAPRTFWGAVVLGQTEQGKSLSDLFNGYSVTSNYPDPDSAYAAALQECNNQGRHNCGGGWSSAFSSAADAKAGYHLKTRCVTVWIWLNPNYSWLPEAKWVGGKEMPPNFHNRKISGHRVICNER